MSLSPLRTRLLCFLGLLAAPLSLSAALSYGSPQFVNTGTGPTQIAVGDFNHDCNVDFATVNLDGNVTLRFGDGAGGFPTTSTLTGFDNALSIASADFNEDGIPDLAVGNSAGFDSNPIGHTISILLADGSGGFAAVSPSPSSDGHVSWIATGDFNGDGHADLAVVDAFSSPAGVRLYLGDGTGQFSSPSIISTDVHQPASVVTADLNADGHADLIVPCGDTMLLFLGAGNGTFAAPTVITYPNSGNGDGAIHAAATDFNHDGHMDVVSTSGTFPGGVTVFLGDGSGTTFSRNQFKMPLDPANPIFVAAADLDGDGNADLVTADQFGCTPYGSNLAVRLGNGDGTFGASAPLSIGYGPTCINSHWQPNWIVPIDLNCDGVNDLIVANMNVTFCTVLLSPGAADSTAPVLTVPPAVSVAAGPSCNAVVSNAQLGTATATDNCSACVVITRTGVPAGNVFPQGTTVVTYTATDGHGNSTQGTQDVTVTAPPLTISGGTASPSTLWPPNHKMTLVTLSYSASGCGSANCSITSVTSNEPVNGLGDGDVAPDWQIVDATHVSLRAERSGLGTGRIYTITVTCTDGGSNTATKQIVVTVPLDQ
jgi:hypothetical protein